MSAKKKYSKKIGKQVAIYSGLGCNREDIAYFIDGVVVNNLNKGELYREDWEKGKAIAKYKVRNAYFQMATSGKHWLATKHYLATQLNIVEPKDPIIIRSDSDMSLKTALKIVKANEESENSDTATSK